jgi:hypothetical protein
MGQTSAASPAPATSADDSDDSDMTVDEDSDMSGPERAAKYRLNAAGELHSDNDLPAVEWADGTLEWHRNGELHRDGDLPAAIDFRGNKYWFQRGHLHRKGGKPAVEWIDGRKYWYQRQGFVPKVDTTALFVDELGRYAVKLTSRLGPEPETITLVADMRMALKVKVLRVAAYLLEHELSPEAATKAVEQGARPRRC